MQQIQLKTFRFKFSPEFTEELERFANIHQYDDRHSFKEAWEAWVTETSAMIQSEIETLTKMGFQGDILDKMFKSARYYYRKKPATPTEKEEKPRKKYTGSSKERIREMDKHISAYVKKHLCPKTNTSTASPAEAYADFIKEYTPSEKEEELFLESKQKKTYKNRYYLVSRNLIY
jgi:hypothetical protein